MTTCPSAVPALRFLGEMARPRGNFARMADQSPVGIGAPIGTLLDGWRTNENHPWKPPGGGLKGALTLTTSSTVWTSLSRSASNTPSASRSSARRPRLRDDTAEPEALRRRCDRDAVRGGRLTGPSGTGTARAAEPATMVLMDRRLPAGLLAGPLPRGSRPAEPTRLHVRLRWAPTRRRDRPGLRLHEQARCTRAHAPHRTRPRRRRAARPRPARPADRHAARPAVPHGAGLRRARRAGAAGSAWTTSTPARWPSTTPRRSPRCSPAHPRCTATPRRWPGGCRRWPPWSSTATTATPLSLWATPRTAPLSCAGSRPSPGRHAEGADLRRAAGQAARGDPAGLARGRRGLRRRRSFRSVADVVDGASLVRVREFKQAAKAQRRPRPLAEQVAQRARGRCAAVARWVVKVQGHSGAVPHRRGAIVTQPQRRPAASSSPDPVLITDAAGRRGGAAGAQAPVRPDDGHAGAVHGAGRGLLPDSLAGRHTPGHLDHRCPGWPYSSRTTGCPARARRCTATSRSPRAGGPTAGS